MAHARRMKKTNSYRYELVQTHTLMKMEIWKYLMVTWN